MLISLKQIYLEYNDKILLDNINMNIDDNDKIGLIGVNGTGKSSLLKIIANFSDLDDDNIMYKKNLKCSYLQQDTNDFETNSMLEYMLKDNNELEFEAKKILTKLDLDFLDNIDTLSGGQKKRLALAKALLIPSDLLLLDEPTNHLDANMIIWLENYLIKLNCAIVMITHDRYFLERVVNKIVEIDKGMLYEYEANYSKYLSLKAQRTEDLDATRRKQLALLKNEEKWMLQGAKARSTKSKDRIERYNKLKENTTLIKDNDLQLSSIESRIGKKILEIKDISIGYPGKTLINDFSYTFKSGDRIGLVGVNGSGKSTLLDTLVYQKSILSGTLDYGSTIKIGYYTQNNNDLDDNLKVIDYIKNKAEFIETVDGVVSASVMLEQFLFEKTQQHSLIGKLSGGEKRRLLLLGVLMEKPNFLLLDEPTNDLDITTLTILESYLTSFSGVVIIVSHDRFFMDRLTNLLWIIKGNQIEFSHEDYSSYLLVDDVTIKKAEKKEYVKVKKLRFSYQEQQEFETIDKDIEQLEQAIVSVNNEMNEYYEDYEIMNKLQEKQKQLENELEAKNIRWLELHEKEEEIDRQESM